MMTLRDLKPGQSAVRKAYHTASSWNQFWFYDNFVNLFAESELRHSEIMAYDNDGYNAQWKSQNDLSKIFRFRDGKRLYTDNDGWKKLQEDTNQRRNTTTATRWNMTNTYGPPRKTP